MTEAAYAAIESTIGAWVEKHNFTLYDSFDGFPGENVRAVYLSSERGECFQIWIDPPELGQVAVHASDVETVLDEELCRDWKVPIAALADVLEEAVAHVKSWMNRK